MYFAEPNDEIGYMNHVVSAKAGEVMDDEAIDIFYKYLDSDWVNWDADDTDGMFVDIFTRTANDIMKKHTTGKDLVKIILIIVAVAVAGFVIVMVITTKRKAEAEKAEETERILNAGPHTYGTSESDKLTEKYDKMEDN